MTDPRLSVRRPLSGLKDRRGATSVEYGLICALVVLAMLVALKGVAGDTIGMWSNISTRVQAAR